MSQPGFPVADIVARVLPWNPCSKVMISKAPPLFTCPHLRASLMAPSFASAPLLAKKTRSNTELAVNLEASAMDGSLK